MTRDDRHVLAKCAFQSVAFFSFSSFVVHDNDRLSLPRVPEPGPMWQGISRLYLLSEYASTAQLYCCAIFKLTPTAIGYLQTVKHTLNNLVGFWFFLHSRKEKAIMTTVLKTFVAFILNDISCKDLYFQLQISMALQTTCARLRKRASKRQCGRTHTRVLCK